MNYMNAYLNPRAHTHLIWPPLATQATGKTTMSLMRSRPLTCHYQLQSFGKFLSSGSRAQSGHFPDPLFLPCGADEKTSGQWGRQFWNHGYNERKTQLHTSLGVTGNTLHSGKAHTHTLSKRTKFPPIVITGNTKGFTKCDFKRLACAQRPSQAINKVGSSSFRSMSFSETHLLTDSVSFM